ncbi:XK-related protein 8 [Acomys russatus]|uniref:XK-related protein 8 n=1 Tax=Acomys russatus TaxID=60746 RepID=UPI0021E22380|nr:XK-related protein 8 [Acomys russatus]
MPFKLSSPLFLQVVVSSMGILSFVLDLAADLWAVVQYMLVGRYLWAALVLTLMGLSSVQLQLFSWVWMRADPSELFWSQYSHRFLFMLHVLQLGYLYRCFHGLQQGLSLCSQELPSEFELAYADFLSLDLSMLRLFESFLESTPQLALVLAIVLLTGQAEYYQWFGILSSFLGISWALLDYHRSLRSCLPAKRNLGWSSSAIYFLWNFLLLGPRIFVISLFSAIYPYYVVMHFFSLWLVLMFWTWLQDTKFMPSPNYEWLYRMSVATILYFSWFNISGGRTRGRAVIHLIFIFSDSVLLVISVLTYITWLPSEILVATYLIIGAVCFLLGLVLRLIYYLWLHPRCFWEPDLVDGTLGSILSPDYTKLLYNRRATQLAQNLFPMAHMPQLAQNLFPKAHMSVILPEKEPIVTS